MYTEELTVPDLDIPFIDMDIPFVELELDDLPSIDKVLRNNPVTLSAPLNEGQTTYSERISIRIPRGILAAMRKQAAARGMPYQTFINLLLAQHAAS